MINKIYIRVYIIIYENVKFKWGKLQEKKCKMKFKIKILRNYEILKNSVWSCKHYMQNFLNLAIQSLISLTSRL